MSMYGVRVSPKNKESIKDYDKFIEEIEERGFSYWDNTKDNKAKTNDKFAFIIGGTKKNLRRNLEIIIFEVVKILPSNYRRDTWQKTIYNKENPSKSDVKDRKVLELSRMNRMNYAEYITKVGYKEKYIPRGTTKMKNIK